MGTLNGMWWGLKWFASGDKICKVTLCYIICSNSHFIDSHWTECSCNYSCDFLTGKNNSFQFIIHIQGLCK